MLPAVDHHWTITVAILLLLQFRGVVHNGEDGHFVERNPISVPIDDLELRHPVCLARLQYQQKHVTAYICHISTSLYVCAYVPWSQ